MKGVAWATPVIAAAAVAPMAAASLPPCVGALSATAGGWSVGGNYPDCSESQHFDVNFVVTLTPCAAKNVTLRIVDLPQYNGNQRRSRLWWDYITGSNANVQLYVQKTVAVPLNGVSQVGIVIAGDTVRRADNGNSVGTIQNPPNNVNDGLHVNPCYVPQNGGSPVAQLWYAYDNGPLVAGPYISASRP